MLTSKQVAFVEKQGANQLKNDLSLSLPLPKAIYFTPDVDGVIYSATFCQTCLRSHLVGHVRVTCDTDTMSAPQKLIREQWIEQGGRKSRRDDGGKQRQG